MVTSGVRIGTPALATRGLGVDDFRELGEIIGLALTPGYAERSGDLAARVRAIADRYPLYAGLRTAQVV